MNKLTLIFPAQGNPIAMKRTIESAKEVADEIIVGSVCLFLDDLELIKSYSKEYNLKVIELPFNYIYANGFSSILNLLASHATNRIVCYLNVGEVISKDHGILEQINNEEYNSFYINHPVELHRWWRLFSPKDLQWSGLLHEELIGEYKPYHRPILTFEDTEKDNDNKLKSIVYDDVKCLCYWNQLCRIVENNSLLGATSGGWLQFASEQYESMQERLKAKGKRWEAFQTGDLEMYMEDVRTNPEFEKQRFESSLLIEYQNGKRYL